MIGGGGSIGVTVENIGANSRNNSMLVLNLVVKCLVHWQCLLLDLIYFTVEQQKNMSGRSLNKFSRDHPIGRESNK